jgi:hypothetical protein
MAEYHRTIIRIVKIDRGYIEFVIDSWNPHLHVRRTTSTLPWRFRQHLLIGDRFFADVNLDAQSEQEIKFKRIEAIPS